MERYRLIKVTHSGATLVNTPIETFDTEDAAKIAKTLLATLAPGANLFRIETVIGADEPLI